MSESEYLVGELGAEIKHEAITGIFHVKYGGLVSHSAFASSFFGAMSGELDGSKCHSFPGDLRVRVEYRWQGDRFSVESKWGVTPGSLCWRSSGAWWISIPRWLEFSLGLSERLIL